MLANMLGPRSGNPRKKETESEEEVEKEKGSKKGKI
jgi:hypothetical protein